MANITELIKNIRNAIFGKDVRESIAGAIEQCYEDGAKSGNANMEVADARGIYDTLKKRLDNSDSVKADKIITNNLQSQINGLASGSPLVANSIVEMTDTSRIYVNTTNGHWYTYNGTSWVDGGVYQATEVAINSIDINKLNDTLKKTINSEIPRYDEIDGFITISGVIDSNNLFRYSSPIKLLKNHTVYLTAKGLSNMAMITECDENGDNRSARIVGIDNTVRNYEYTSDKDTYIIISYTSTVTPIIFINDNLKDYINETNNKIENIISILTSKVNSNIDISIINDTNKGISSTGVYSAVGFHNCSDFIFLKSGTKIAYRLRNATNNYLNVAIYNSNKQFLKGIEGEKNTYKTGIVELENDSYVRFMTNFDVSDLFITTDVNSIDILKKFYNFDNNNYLDNILLSANNVNMLSIFKKMAVIGDSLSSGAIEGEGSKDNFNLSWLDQICKTCGNEAVHFSRSGETTKSWLDRNYDLSSNICEAYFIALGTNDRGAGYSVGTVDDVGTDNESFYGYYSKIITKIKEVAPDSKLFLCNLYGDPNSDNNIEINTAIQYFVKNTENAYLVDISNTLSSYYHNYIVGGHFSAIGYKFMADYIMKKCYQIIINNYTDFSNVGLY